MSQPSIISVENPDPRWNNAVYSSWMMKRGSFVKNWKKRWFILTLDGKLFYFAKPTDKKPKKDCVFVSQFKYSHDDKKPNCIKIERKKGDFYFAADTMEIRDKWFEMLEKVGGIREGGDLSNPSENQLSDELDIPAPPPNPPNFQQPQNLQQQQPPQQQQVYGSQQQMQQQPVYSQNNQQMMQQQQPQQPQSPSFNPNYSPQGPQYSPQYAQQQPPQQQQQIPFQPPQPMQYQQPQAPQQPSIHEKVKERLQERLQKNNKKMEEEAYKGGSPLHFDNVSGGNQKVSYANQLPVLSQVRLLAKQNLENQMNQHNIAVNQNPNNPIVYYNRGRFSWEIMNNFNGGLIDMNKALQLNPKFVPAIVEIGAIYVVAAKPEQGAAEFRKIYGIDPNYRDFRINLYMGKVMHDQAKYKEAISSYDFGLSVCPNNMRLLVGKAMSYQLIGKMREATLLLKQILTLPTKTYFDFRSKGVAYLLLGNRQQCIVETNKAIDLNPFFYLAWNVLGVIYMGSDVNKAISNFLMVNQLNPSFSGAYQNLALLFLGSGDLTNCWNFAIRAEQLSPNDPNVYVIKGNVFIRRGQQQNANVEFRKAIAIQPSKEKELRAKGLLK